MLQNEYLHISKYIFIFLKVYIRIYKSKFVEYLEIHKFKHVICRCEFIVLDLYI